MYANVILSKCKFNFTIRFLSSIKDNKAVQLFEVTLFVVVLFSHDEIKR